jgi:hypothetical protein
MKRNIVLALLSLVVFSTLLSKLSYAQGLGSIVGTVKDPSGAAIVSAKIRATQVGTSFSREAATNDDGYFVISSLSPVSYKVTTEASGFSVAKQDVALLADQTLTLNVKMQVGMTNQVVEVSSNAFQVDTATSTIRQVIEQQRIAELPLNGRNAATLTLLVAGAVNSPNGGADQGATKTFPGAVTFSANGARQNSISYQLDGGNYVQLALKIIF